MSILRTGNLPCVKNKTDYEALKLDFKSGNEQRSVSFAIAWRTRQSAEKYSGNAEKLILRGFCTI